MQPIIDKEKCIGCGTCIALCPGSFKWDESGTKAEAIVPPADNETALKDTAAACPVQVISFE